MEIYLTADHNGFELKNELCDWLKSEGQTVIDLGPATFDKNDDYPDYGIKLAEMVAQKPDKRLGISICGSGVGMAIAANKVYGIRASAIQDPELAASARQDDNINVLALGSRFIDTQKAKDIITAWLAVPFSKEERFVRRLNKIHAYEKDPTTN